ncbi:unnamed protein product [Meganyctiphanes norvegica]|uniref:KICSTOR complex protein kaptin n=1 Tax=Meganyctiphanes norvegica TaxID=48144 RepID=A0AAV2SM92_MEGNR
MTQLTDANGGSKFLVASMQRKVYCLECSHGHPYMKEIPFTYIPGGADIISIDAINKSVIKDDFIIGITIIKRDEAQQTQFFNIYSEWDLNSDSALDAVSQSCLALELNFVPYQLYHTETRLKHGWETVWLLSGSDCRIHIYQPDDESSSYQETDETQHFPEFAKLEEVTLWMDVYYSQDKHCRITGICGEGGTVQVFHVNVEGQPKITASQKVEWDYPSICIKIFNPNNYIPVPEFLKKIPGLEKLEAVSNDIKVPKVVVANALESAFVYDDFLDDCIAMRLQDSDSQDVVTCCIVCDVNQNGRNEILLGTYGEVVLIYGQKSEGSEWSILFHLPVASPVLAMAYCGILEDGSKQLLVMTTTGIHVFQHNPLTSADLLLKRLKSLMSHASLCSKQNI